MGRIRDILRDLALSLALGCGIGLAGGVLLFAAGALAGRSVSAGLNTARSGLMLAGGFVLLFSAGLFLKGDNLPEDAFRLRLRSPARRDTPPLPKLFRVLHRKYTALMTGAGILLSSGAADCLVRRWGA